MLRIIFRSKATGALSQLEQQRRRRKRENKQGTGLTLVLDQN